MKKNIRQNNLLKTDAQIGVFSQCYGYRLEFIGLRWIQAMVKDLWFLTRNREEAMAVLNRGFKNGAADNAISESLEEQIEERIEEQIEVEKRRLERAFSGQALSDAVFQRLQEIDEFLKLPTEGGNKLLRLSDKLKIASVKMSKLVDSYKKCLPDEIAQNFIICAQGLNAWSETTKAVHFMPRSFSPQLSTSSLRRWANGMETFAGIVEKYDESIPRKVAELLTEFSQGSLEVCQKSNWSGSLKEKYRKKTMYAAGFLLQQLEHLDYHESEQQKELEEAARQAEKGSWKLVLGKKPYDQLLKESQENIHLIDSLYSGEEEEAREQAEALEYIQRELNKP